MCVSFRPISWKRGRSVTPWIQCGMKRSLMSASQRKTCTGRRSGLCLYLRVWQTHTGDNSSHLISEQLRSQPLISCSYILTFTYEAQLSHFISLAVGAKSCTKMKLNVVFAAFRSYQTLFVANIVSRSFPDSLAASNSLIGLNQSFTESETTAKSAQRAAVNKAVCQSYQINSCSQKRLVVVNEAIVKNYSKHQKDLWV